MKKVKQQYINPLSENHGSIQTYQSAFKPYKQQQDEYDGLDMGFDIETYINKRKFENSFTLSEISVSSSDVKKEKLKIQSSKETQETYETYQQFAMKQQSQKTLSIVSQVQFFYKPKLTKRKLLCSQVFSVKYSPKPKQLNSIGTQYEGNSIFSNPKKETKLQQFCTEEQSQTQKPIIDFVKKSKKEKKQQKIREKKEKQPNKQQKIQQNEPKRKVRRQKNLLKILDQKHSSKEEVTSDFPFEGVLRNCQCCGKLISKLCFKCPHIYCKAQNCPRKRKKILNQKMLEKMKEQKIKEHYRQRELYQKMKLQQGGQFNPKVSEALKKQRNQNNVPKNQKKSRTKQNKHLKMQIETSQNQWKTSEEQYQSELLYDSNEEESEKSKPKRNIVINSKKDEKNINKKQSQFQLKQQAIDQRRYLLQNDKQKPKKSSKTKQNQETEHQKHNYLQKMNSFSLSLFTSNEQSNTKNLEQVKEKKKSNKIINQKQQRETKQSFKLFNDCKSKSKKIECYFDDDFESTF